MTPKAQRIAIAEACGWTRRDVDYGPRTENLWISPEGLTNGVSSTSFWLPDYLSDLNAMHEAEKVLQQIQHDYSHGFANEWQYGCWTRYITTLKNLTKSARTFLGGEIHATAAQRAEAFLRTIGKWVDA